MEGPCELRGCLSAGQQETGEGRLRGQLERLADGGLGCSELQAAGELLTAQVGVLQRVADEHPGRRVCVAQLVDEVDGFSASRGEYFEASGRPVSAKLQSEDRCFFRSTPDPFASAKGCRPRLSRK